MLSYQGFLDKGVHGQVSLYQNEKKELFAVKSQSISIGVATEIEILQRLAGCDCVIPYYGQVQEGTRVHMVFKFYKWNLLKLCAKPNRDQWAKPVFFQILRGVAQCHAHGVLHLDLKPSNIMVNDQSCEIRLIDFGLSRIRYDRKMVWTREVVTPTYRAPELLRHESYDEKVDMFSLGVILANMFGHVKTFFSSDFDDDDIQYAYLVKTLWTLPRNYAALVPGFPKEALSLLANLLEFDPQKRFSAEEAMKHPWFAS